MQVLGLYDATAAPGETPWQAASRIYTESQYLCPTQRSAHWLSTGAAMRRARVRTDGLQPSTTRLNRSRVFVYRLECAAAPRPPHHAVSTPSYRQNRVESSSQQTPLSGRPRLRALACAHASCEARGASRALWQGSRAAAMRMCANAMRMCANMAMQVRAFDHAADRRGAVLEPVVPGLHSLRQHDSRARGGRPHGPSRIFCVLKQILRATPRSHCRAPLRIPLPPSHCNDTTADRTVTSHCVFNTPRAVAGRHIPALEQRLAGRRGQDCGGEDARLLAALRRDGRSRRRRR